MQNIRRKGITILTAAMIAVMGTFTGFFGGFGKTWAAEDYHTWRQMDERWGSVNMNGTTVSRSGCLITSLSIMIMHSGSLDAAAMSNMGIKSEDQFNPGVLANAYSARGGFTYGGGIASWGTIGQIVPAVTFVKDAYLKSYSKSDIAKELKEMMDSGLHIILNVNGHHWVYIEGVIGDDIYMIDPASDKRLIYDEYSVGGGNEYWALKCSNPPSMTETKKEPAEYFCTASGNVPVYEKNDASSRKIAELTDGNVVNIIDFKGDFGLIANKQADGSWSDAGWINIKNITEAEASKPHIMGDINNDSVIDMYDLALLNEYLRSKKTLPKWASVLRQCEIEAADINSDGNVDDADLLLFLEYICD